MTINITTPLAEPPPPVIELVIGVEYDRVDELHSGFFGEFWSKHRDDFPGFVEAEPINDQKETFEDKRFPQFPMPNFSIGPRRSRAILEASGKSELIQLQDTRFHFNWRKVESHPYPSFTSVLDKFLTWLKIWQDFVLERTGQNLQFNFKQWEVTYVDAFPRDEDWQTSSDWAGLLPGLGVPSTTSDRMLLETVDCSADFRVNDPLSRLHSQIRTVSLDGVESLLLQWVLRGPIQTEKSEPVNLHELFTRAHDVLYKEYKSRLPSFITSR